MYLKSPGRWRDKIYCRTAIQQSIVVYLKSPRRWREQKLFYKCYIAEYRCVPKIASPEARKKCVVLCVFLYENLQFWMLVALGPSSDHKEGMIKKSRSLPRSFGIFLICSNVFLSVLLFSYIFPMLFNFLLFSHGSYFLITPMVSSYRLLSFSFVYSFSFANSGAGGLEPSLRPQAGND